MTRVGEPVTVTDRSRRAFARRARARRLLALRPLLVLAAVLALLAGAAWLVLVSPVLGVREVRVEVHSQGEHRVDPLGVRRLADVRTGTPLARLDTAGISRRVRTIPGVARIAVHRRWPSTVVLEVTERTPVAAVPAGGRTMDLVDADGVAFQQVAAAPAGLPVVLPGGRDREGALRAALQVLDALPPSMRGGVLRAVAPSPEQVTLRLRSGPVVVWGGAGDGAQKVAVLRALLKYPAAVYDVSAPDAPTTRTTP